MAKLYEVRLSCRHTNMVTAEPSSTSSLTMFCNEPECGGKVRTVVAWTGETEETGSPVKEVKKDEAISDYNSDN